MRAGGPFAVIIIISELFLFSVSGACEEKAYRRSSYSRPDEAVLNRAGNWLVTFGKPERERAAIERQRRRDSLFKNAQKRARRQRRIAEKRMRAAQQSISGGRDGSRRRSERIRHTARIEPAPAPVFFTAE